MKPLIIWVIISVVLVSPELFHGRILGYYQRTFSISHLIFDKEGESNYILQKRKISQTYFDGKPEFPYTEGN